MFLKWHSIVLHGKPVLKLERHLKNQGLLWHGGTCCKKRGGSPVGYIQVRKEASWVSVSGFSKGVVYNNIQFNEKYNMGSKPSMEGDFSDLGD